jgi:hypothetical protein
LNPASRNNRIIKSAPSGNRDSRGNRGLANPVLKTLHSLIVAFLNFSAHGFQVVVCGRRSLCPSEAAAPTAALLMKVLRFIIGGP